MSSVVCLSWLVCTGQGWLLILEGVPGQWAWLSRLCEDPSCLLVPLLVCRGLCSLHIPILLLPGQGAPTRFREGQRLGGRGQHSVCLGGATLTWCSVPRSGPSKIIRGKLTMNRLTRGPM